ncbi:MAG: phosphoribosyltransferase [Candidatus Bathyarchaeota archaeon]|nr:phosphoribosyltransferase [Candidatus Bathyarchaeota archaeon]
MSSKFDCQVMDWYRFQLLAEKTARKVVDSGYKPDIIVGLARGGWVLSRVLCDYLGVKDLVSLKVEHWGVTATPDGKARIKYPFNIDLSGYKVLVVDDITDTGLSMIAAMSYVNTLNPLVVKTATLQHITGSQFTPDYYGEKISWCWVIFPWNYIEDISNIIMKIDKNGVTDSEIAERLKSDHRIEANQGEIKRIRNEIRRRNK